MFASAIHAGSVEGGGVESARAGPRCCDSRSCAARTGAARDQRLEHVPAFASLVKEFMLTELLADLDPALVEFSDRDFGHRGAAPGFRGCRAPTYRQSRDAGRSRGARAFLQCLDIANGSWTIPPLVRRGAVSTAPKPSRSGRERATQSRGAVARHARPPARRRRAVHRRRQSWKRRRERSSKPAVLSIALSHGDSALRNVLDLLPVGAHCASPRLGLGQAVRPISKGLQSEAQQMFEELNRVTEGFTKERGGPGSLRVAGATRCSVRCLDAVLSGRHDVQERLKALEQELVSESAASTTSPGG